MNVFAISDLHLSFGVKNKSMDIFGPNWENHAEKLQHSWDNLVKPQDIVLIAGDLSWAMKLDDAMADLEWLEKRPGRKILIKGNHDYWWGSLSKLRACLPKSIHVIQNDVVELDGIAVGGAKFWDSPEYSFHSIIEFQGEKGPPQEATPHLFDRELMRLEESLKKLPQSAFKIAMTHYPPIGLDLLPSKASLLFEKYKVDLVVFGHLHSIKKEVKELFGYREGIPYVLTSADWLEFSPLLVRKDGVLQPSFSKRA